MCWVENGKGCSMWVIFRVTATSHICSSCSGNTHLSVHPVRAEEGVLLWPACQKLWDTQTAGGVGRAGWVRGTACMHACVSMSVCVSVGMGKFLSKVHCASSCVWSEPSVPMSVYQVINRQLPGRRAQGPSRWLPLLCCKYKNSGQILRTTLFNLQYFMASFS